MIKLDKSATGIVIVCTEHPWWAAFRFHLDEAHAAACAHERAWHPDEKRAQRAAEKARERAATRR